MCYGISVLFLGEKFILKDFMMQCFPFSHTGGRWFITYYFWLMLLAPVLNLVGNMSLKEHCAIVLINLFAIIWWGLVWQSDVVNGGKSIVYFVGLYLTGNLLRRLNNFNMSLPYLATLKGNFIAYIYYFGRYFFSSCFFFESLQRGIFCISRTWFDITVCGSDFVIF